MRLIGPILIALVTVSVLLLAISAGARGQSEATSVSFEDAALDAFPPPTNAYADIVSASAALQEDGKLRVSLTLTLLPEIQPGMGYGMLFDVDGSTWFGAAVTDPTLNFYYGPWAGDEPADSSDTTGGYTAGPGASIWIDVPTTSFPRGATIDNFMAGVIEVKTVILPFGLPAVWLDEAPGEGALVLAGPTQPAATEPAAPAPVKPAEATQSPRPAEPAESVEAPAAQPRNNTPALGLAGLLGAGVLAWAGRRRLR